ncbi:hypothetical protein DR73_3479 [Enterobacteriaceae bacterium ATCC 29904]|nr:hypothetical protein DR73_3479 [Enterobacteriaceae bacterium ATCC 29904]
MPIQEVLFCREQNPTHALRRPNNRGSLALLVHKVVPLGRYQALLSVLWWGLSLAILKKRLRVLPLGVVQDVQRV